MVIWQGRADSLPGERLFQAIRCISPTKLRATRHKNAWAVLGFAVDEGIVRNLGRKGAKEGPDYLRKALSNAAIHVELDLVDLGNIYCENKDLEAVQASFGAIISNAHQLGYKTIGLGGGHDIAWAHYQGLKNYANLGIINIDAHFDLRPFEGKSTSGTPFTQIAIDCEINHKPFSYCCLGIQELSNTRSLFERAHKLGVHYLTAEVIKHQSKEKTHSFLQSFIEPLDAVYLTLCLDAFAESVAPGVSAPQPLGLYPEEMIPLLKSLVQSGKVIALDVAELSPPLDVNSQTARLGAMILATLLNSN